MGISKRLKHMASYMEGYETLADIACDHGYLGIYAAKEYALKEVLLTDINPMPLESAIQNTKNANLENVISCRLGDGLKPLEHPYDLISISGIGGSLLVDILKEGIDIAGKAKRLILCPNSELPLLRKFLMDNLFEIEVEEMVYDYKYYEIIVASYKGIKKDYTSMELEFGPYLLTHKSKEFYDYYEKKLHLLERQISKVKNPKERILMEGKITSIRNVISNK